MKIASYEIAQQANHVQFSQVKKETSVQMQRQDGSVTSVVSTQSSKELERLAVLELSSAGLAKAGEKSDDMIIHYSEEDLAKIELIESFITHLMGKRFRFKHVPRDEEGNVKRPEGGAGGHKLPSPSPQENLPAGAPIRKQQGPRGPVTGIRITNSQMVEEYETMQFQSKGSIRTGDGREINFEVNMNFSRYYYEENKESITIGEFHDPIVLDLTGEGIGFTDKTLKLDLDVDGKVDAFRALTQNAGILVLDKNGDGLVNDGKEVVGAENGQGFGTLAAHDIDGNHFLDESDALYDQLKLWVVDQGGNQKLIGLKEAGVGAIFLGATETPYEFKDGLNGYARIKQSAVYVKESGQVLGAHEIDLKI